MPTIFGMFFSINEGFKTLNLNFTIKLGFDSRPNQTLSLGNRSNSYCRELAKTVKCHCGILGVNFFNSQNDQTFKVKKVAADLSNKYRNHEVFRYY